MTNYTFNQLLNKKSVIQKKLNLYHPSSIKKQFLITSNKMICTTKKIKLLLHSINTYISFIMSNTQQLQDFTTQVRRDILRMVHAVNSGHPGGSLGCAEFLVTLYQDVMKRNEGFDMNGIGEDLFFLSNGHISPVF